MLLLILALLLLIVFVYCIDSLLVGYSLAERFIAAFLCASAYIIFTFEIASLFSALDKPYAILLIQLLITVITALLLRKKLLLPSTKSIKEDIRGAFESLRAFIKQTPFLSLYFFIIVLAYGFLFFLSIYFPQNTSDALYNHLSRIGYWLQQGSLKPYIGFNNIGATYPYNNSLLMLWPIAFLRSDVLSGSVQFFATITAALIVYRIGVELGFPRKNSLLSALLFLTFPIVLLQSITAQNDALAACFIGAAFLFLLKAYKKEVKGYLILSALAYALAIGTKQYALFALPGYLLLLIVVLLHNKGNKSRIIVPWVVSFLVFTFAVGSYNYVQNVFTVGSLFGESSVVSTETIDSQPSSLFQKLSINSARLFTQFISCEGLPQGVEQSCIQAKASLLTPVFANRSFNIENKVFLLEQETPFKLTNQFALNEESAWFGILSWIVILPAIVYGFIYSLKHKRFDGLVIILTSLFFFGIISSFKNGWDPYSGRYLITFVVLLMPFTALLFNQKKWFTKGLVAILCVSSIFITAYTIINNDSRPLIGKTQFYRTKWEDFTIPQKIAFQFLPLIKNDNNVWGDTRIQLRTYDDINYQDPLEIVDAVVPESASLGIVAKEGYIMDYLFFGDSFGRKIVAIKNGDFTQQPDSASLDYLLISPDYPTLALPNFEAVTEQKGWRILKRIG